MATMSQRNTPVPLLRSLTANQYEPASVSHRAPSYWFLLVPISSRPRPYWFGHNRRPSAIQYDCFELFKTIVLIRRGPAYSYCIAEHRINSCQFLLVRISSYLIRISSYRNRTGSCCLSGAIQYDAIRCATMRYKPTRIDTV